MFVGCIVGAVLYVRGSGVGLVIFALSALGGVVLFGICFIYNTIQNTIHIFNYF